MGKTHKMGQAGRRNVFWCPGGCGKKVSFSGWGPDAVYKCTLCDYRADNKQELFTDQINVGLR